MAGRRWGGGVPRYSRRGAGGRRAAKPHGQGRKGGRWWWWWWWWCCGCCCCCLLCLRCPRSLSGRPVPPLPSPAGLPARSYSAPPATWTAPGAPAGPSSEPGRAVPGRSPQQTPPPHPPLRAAERGLRGGEMRAATVGAAAVRGGGGGDGDGGDGAEGGHNRQPTVPPELGRDEMPAPSLGRVTTQKYLYAHTHTHPPVPRNSGI